MQKLSFLLLLFLVTSFVHAQQSGEIIYKIKLSEQYKNQKDTTKSKEEAKEKTKEEVMAESFVAEIFEKQEKILPFISYELIFNKNEALFFSEESMQLDSGQDLIDPLMGTGTKGKFYTNLSEDLTLRKFHYTQLILLESKISDLAWKIVKETKNIAGYNCQKATTTIYINSVHPEKEITVWFAKDLPFSFGPAGMVGLPGMILGYERSKFFIYANEIKLSEKDRKITKPTKGKKVTQDFIIKKNEEIDKRMNNLIKSN
ncbi:MAG TPA: GLPGLI family protein [Flavobacteriaceae bacterium]|nr:GLPGLI family protein [Flavobacteriaceae bacterium]